MIRPRPDVTVDRARVMHAVPASRAHLESALARVSPAAVGVPPGALLLIRRLACRARLGPGARADTFVATLQESLRDRLARARAPGVGGEGDDLLFPDEADLAAAVIASWLDGTPSEARGWWQVVTAGDSPPIWWRRAILPDARLLPRVVAALARQQRAPSWIARLDPAEVYQATRLLAATHGITLGTPLTAATHRKAPRSKQTAEARKAATVLRTLVPEAVTTGLSHHARALLALALVLDRRPALVRTAAFAPALAQFVADPPTATHIGASEPGQAPAATHTVPKAQFRPVPPLDDKSAPQRPPASERPRSALLPNETPLILPVETDFGGLFFLLNALLAMEVYGDFTRPLAMPNAPPPFDLLALLGRRWFGARFRRDPVDALLATLAGREADEPIRFAPPMWHVPQAWLAPWPPPVPDSPWHPAGFPLDLTTDDHGLPRRPDTRWVAALSLYLHARLARALGTSDRQAVGLACRHRAAIACAGDRLTVTFALAAHPLALRLAGLDRDPGYILAARREIAFVFA